MSGWFNDAQKPPMAWADYQKVIDIGFIFQRIFVFLENIFISEVF